MRWHYIKKDEWPEETDTMVLCECHFVDKFPMNAAGKILKYKMREESVERLGLKVKK